MIQLKHKEIIDVSNYFLTSFESECYRQLFVNTVQFPAFLDQDTRLPGLEERHPSEQITVITHWLIIVIVQLTSWVQPDNARVIRSEHRLPIITTPSSVSWLQLLRMRVLKLFPAVVTNAVIASSVIMWRSLKDKKMQSVIQSHVELTQQGWRSRDHHTIFAEKNLKFPNGDMKELLRENDRWWTASPFVLPLVQLLENLKARLSWPLETTAPVSELILEASRGWTKRGAGPANNLRSPFDVSRVQKDRFRWLSLRWREEEDARYSREMSVIDSPDKSRNFNCRQWEAIDWQVASVKFLQSFKSRDSKFGHDMANWLRASSVRDRHPRKDRAWRKPPVREDSLWITGELISVWNEKRSTDCQFEPSNAREFHALETWAARQRLTTSKNEKTLNSSSLGRILSTKAVSSSSSMTVSSVSWCLICDGIATEMEGMPNREPMSLGLEGRMDSTIVW